ncbi:Acetyltransferase (GNAT) family protein [Gemmata sp. SH-PL17]|uniref:GNAT family N-acetyltransferase n=1 Tax=Gemmata sp. SH-PL17 TaxID=1630693 RepID=UPI0004B1C467|nr:N-acetyltransferase [Gemmata sp. SH-PL17]AMV28522.1 Acetyltransferase (GNAT) family protein [Gemmata sp. SH-PL17]
MNLYRDAHYTFRFTEDRLIPRFHLEGVESGHAVTVFALTDDGSRSHLLAKARVGEGGWVELAEPLVVRAGSGFVAVPAPVYTIRDEAPNDADGVRLVNRLAFNGDAEAELVEALRAGGYVRASLVAECEGRIVGHVLFSDLPIVTERGIVSALAFAPMAVLPEFQNLGVGSRLVPAGLDACRDRGHRIVVVLGHPAFYPRFGFSPALAAKLSSPFSGEAFMAAELVPGALTGVAGRVEYTPPFGAWV